MIKLNKYINEAWSGVKQHTNIEDIKAWCEEMGIRNYTINPQGEIDVDGNVYLNDKKFKELPFKFGKINGWFNLGGSKNLTSLKNCPNYVEDYFSCSFCLKLDSLEGCPKEVKGNFNCSYCSQLDSLEGCPKKVGRHFKCGDCKRDFTKEEVQSLCKVKRAIIV